MNETFRRFFATRAPALFLLPFLVAACIDDPTGPSALGIRTVGASPDSMWIGAPGEPIPTGVAIRVTNLQNGEPVAGATVTWESFDQNGAVVHASAHSDAKGLATAVWQLGTSAGEQKLLVSVRSGQRTGELRLRALAVPHVVAQLRISVDSLTVVRLGDSLPISVTAVDPYGNVFTPPAPRLSLSDTTVGTVAGSVFLAGPRRGATELEIVSNHLSARIPLRVVQHVAAIVPHTTALSFSSLGAELPIRYAVLDDRGRVVADTTAALSVADTTVAQLSDTLVKASKTGSTELRFTVGTATTTIPVAVRQRIASLRLLRDTVRFDALRDTTTIQPVAIDSLGSSVLNPDLVYELSDARVVTLAGASLLEATKPGVSALTLRDPITGVSATMPIVVQQRVSTIQVFPIIFDALGDTLPIAAIAWDRLGSPVVGASLAYSINDPSVATIESGGRLRSHGEGRAVITVSDLDNGTSDAADIVVWQRVASLSLFADSLAFDALGDSLPLSFVAKDRLGAVAPSATTSCSSSDTAVATVGLAAVVRSLSNGWSAIVCRSTDGPVDTVIVNVAQRVRQVLANIDSARFVALHATARIHATAVDRLGFTINNAIVNYAVGDTTVAKLTPSSELEAMSNGTTQLTITVDSFSSFIPIFVAQEAARIVLPADTIRFTALDERAQILGTVVDSLGYPLIGASPNITVGDTSIVIAVDSATLQARANGITTVRFANGSTAAFVQAVVQQVPESLTVTVQSPDPILALPINSLLPLSCTVFDRNGFPINEAQPSVTPRRGTIVGSACDDARAYKSGFDTLRFEAGSVTKELAVVVAVPPIPSSRRGDFLNADSIPSGTFPWAPTARLVGSTIELYFGAYSSAPSAPEHILGGLHRLTSTDGVNFVYDGKMLARDSIQCPSLDGSGIENIAIVPRNDASGWRMFYSGGSFNCYGWQVFSAVSDDGRNWVKEPGVRLSNGGQLPPAAPWTSRYPVGEGMYVDQLPSGEYRMIVGSFEHIDPPPTNLWQIVEWRSPDQLNWTYRGPILTTRDMPPAGQGSVYSPTITEISPGIWRMIFTADARGTAGSRSALWSAVSLDKTSWQVEGVVLGESDTDLYYATLAGDYLFFIRKDLNGWFRLASTRLQMP